MKSTSIAIFHSTLFLDGDAYSNGKTLNMNIMRFNTLRNRAISGAIFLFLLYTSYSCKKEDPAESYLRGGNCLIATPDGNMLIAGFNTGGGGSYDGYLTKVDTSGNILWGNHYGNNLTDGFYKVIAAPGGGYVATGFISVSSNLHTNLVIVKVKETGEQEWMAFFGGDSISQGFSLATTKDNGYLACGYIQDGINDDRDLYFVKVNAGGEKVWEKRYGNQVAQHTASAYDEAYDIVSCNDSTFYVTGSLAGKSNCCGNLFIMKLNEDGDSLWTQSFSEGLGYSIITALDDGLVVGGMVAGNGQDVYALKTDMDGEKIWDKTIGGTGYDFGTSIVKSVDNAYTITGITNKTGSANQDILLNKLNSSGTLQWSKSFGEENVEQGIGLISFPDGGYSITGLSNSGGSFIFLNRTDSAGVERWKKKIK